MKPMHRVAVFAALACAVIAVIRWRQSSPPEMANDVQVARANPPRETVDASTAGVSRVREDAANRGLRSPIEGVAGGVAGGVAPRERSTAAAFEEPWRGDSYVVWPVARADRAAAASTAAAPAGESEVPVKVAFRALWYLGTDPEAEKTWSRAINDPKSPPGVRSDLIVDMIDEGYTDNEHPTVEDLPVILARLDIIERYAPHAMDDVNRAAFEEAYRHLLQLYDRLGGKPREAR